MIEKALEIVEDRHDGTFSEMLALSTLPKQKYEDAYKLASVMDLLYTIELREKYREMLKEILLSLQKTLSLIRLEKL